MREKKSYITMLQLAQTESLLHISFSYFTLHGYCKNRFRLAKKKNCLVVVCCIGRDRLFMMAFAAMHSCYHVPLHNQNTVYWKALDRTISRFKWSLLFADQTKLKSSPTAIQFWVISCIIFFYLLIIQTITKKKQSLRNFNCPSLFFFFVFIFEKWTYLYFSVKWNDIIYRFVVISCLNRKKKQQHEHNQHKTIQNMRLIYWIEPN